MDKTLIIIVNYNNHIDTLECIDSIKKYENTNNYDIYLIDNSQESYTQYADLVSYYHIVKNNGYSDAVNYGIRAAQLFKYKFTLLLNNDTNLKSAILDDLIETFSINNKIIAVSPKIIKKWKNELVLHYAGGFLKTLINGLMPRGDFTQNLNDFSYIEKVDWVSGACMLIKTSAFKKIGIFDSSYFLYYEDVDWSVRAQKLGYLNYYNGNVNIFHKQSRSTAYVKSFYKWDSHFLFLLKYFPKIIIPSLKKIIITSTHYYFKTNNKKELFTQIKWLIKFLVFLPKRLVLYT
jgi:GT2 family glycosyltransferase